MRMGIGGWLKERWRLVKVSRANLVLVIAGAALLVLAPAWRLGVAPAIKVVANDFDSLYAFNGSLAVEPPPGVPGVEATAPPGAVPVLIEQRLSGRPDLSTPRVSAVQENLRTLVLSTGEELPAAERIFTLDRRSGEMVDAEGADRERSGYYVVFPFNTPEEDLPYWMEQAGRAVTAVFRDNADIEGTPVRTFDVEYHNVPVQAPDWLPDTLTGAELKSWLRIPGLDMGDGETVALDYLAAGRRTIFVEPVAGTPVKLENAEESLSVAAVPTGNGYAVTGVVSSLRYSQSDESVVQAAGFARDEVAKIRLQFTYIPLGLAVLGLAVLLTGAFAGMSHIRKNEEEGAATPSADTG